MTEAIEDRVFSVKGVKDPDPSKVLPGKWQILLSDFAVILGKLRAEELHLVSSYSSVV